MRRCGCCWPRLAHRGIAPARTGTPARVPGGRGKSHASAIYVRDRAPGATPADRPRSSSVPGCGPPWEAVGSNRVGRTRAAVKKFWLRDHALAQPEDLLVLAAKSWHADGAHVGPGRAGFWRHRPDVVGLAGVPPASVGPGAGIRGPGSNAGSDAAVGTCGHSLCADRAGGVVVGSDNLAYDDAGPRERLLPRDSPGRMR